VQQHSLQRSVTSLTVSCAYRRDGRKCLCKLLVDRVELLAVAAPAATCTPVTRASEGCSTRRAPCKARDAACAVQRAKCSVVACNVRRAAAVPHETIQQSNTIGVCYGAKNSTTTSFVASVTIDRTVAPTTTCACHVLHSCNYKPRWHPLEASRSPGGDVAAKARQITNDTCRLHGIGLACVATSAPGLGPHLPEEDVAGVSVPSPGADVAAAQMWERRAQSRCRCGHGAGPRLGGSEPSPGADVAGVSPVPVQMWPRRWPAPRRQCSRRRIGAVAFGGVAQSITAACASLAVRRCC
jgi:hypothetical protein